MDVDRKSTRVLNIFASFIILKQNLKKISLNLKYIFLTAESQGNELIATSSAT